MKQNISLEAFYPDPPERVWRALTDSAALGFWLMPTDFKPEVGFRFSFTGSGRNHTAKIEGEVLCVEEAKLLAYTWDDGEDEAPGIVCWTLTPKDGGTHLALKHEAEAEVKPYVLIEASMNWHHAMGASLPVALRLIEAERRMPRVPIVFVLEDPKTPEEQKRRAGFRQEETTCPR